MISYEKLRILIAKHVITYGTLRRDLKLSSKTIVYLKEDLPVDLLTLVKLCRYFRCNIGDIMDIHIS